MKRIEDVCFVIQARLNSERTPGKMMNPFAGTSLVEIACQKIKQSNIIPNENFYFSAYEKPIIDAVERSGLQVYYRSKKSALAEGPMQVVMEYHDKLDYKYLVVISACCPLLGVSTIDKFVRAYLESENDGMFAVFEKRNYFWDQNHDMITGWPSGLDALNTKFVEVTYEAAHCLYAGKMSTIKDGIWMAEQPFTKNKPELFIVPEFEVFDIDFPWQFTVAEILYVTDLVAPVKEDE